MNSRWPEIKGSFVDNFSREIVFRAWNQAVAGVRQPVWTQVEILTGTLIRAQVDEDEEDQ